MHNVGVSFEILDCDQHVPVICKKVTEHMDFNVKMDFTSKAH